MNGRVSRNMPNDMPYVCMYAKSVAEMLRNTADDRLIVQMIVMRIKIR